MCEEAEKNKGKVEKSKEGGRLVGSMRRGCRRAGGGGQARSNRRQEWER